MIARTIDKTEIEKSVLATMRAALENPSIDTNASVDNVDGWDSMGHLTLVTALEEAWGITFSFSEIVSLSSFKNIIDSLITKDVM